MNFYEWLMRQTEEDCCPLYNQRTIASYYDQYLDTVINNKSFNNPGVSQLLKIWDEDKRYEE